MCQHVVRRQGDQFYNQKMKVVDIFMFLGMQVAVFALCLLFLACSAELPLRTPIGTFVSQGDVNGSVGFLGIPYVEYLFLLFFSSITFHFYDP